MLLAGVVSAAGRLSKKLAAVALLSMILPPTHICTAAEPPAPVADPAAPVKVVPLEPSDEATKVDLLELVVEGNTVLDTKTIYETVEPFLGPRKTLDDVDNIRAALEETYH